MDEDERNNNVDKYLMYSIKLYKEILDLEEKIKKTFFYSKNSCSYDNFLVDKNYINDIETILHFKEIYTFLNSNHITSAFLKTQKNEEDILKRLKKQLNPETINELEKLDENLKLKNSYELKAIYDNKYKANKPSYYKDCKIINMELSKHH